MFTAALFTVAKTWKQPKRPSTDEWIKKMWYIYTMDYYSAMKKSWSSAICSNVDGPRDSHTKQSKRKTNTIWYHLHVGSKIWHKWTYLQNRNRLTDTEKRLVVAGAGGMVGKDWEFGISRCKLLYREWINKVPLYSTGNYIQYPVTNHSGKEYKGLDFKWEKKTFPTWLLGL